MRGLSRACYCELTFENMPFSFITSTYFLSFSREEKFIYSLKKSKNSLQSNIPSFRVFLLERFYKVPLSIRSDMYAIEFSRHWWALPGL
jgi:hypothetical protein